MTHNTDYYSCKMQTEKLPYQPKKTLAFSPKISRGWRNFLNLMNTSQKTEILNLTRSWRLN